MKWFKKEISPDQVRSLVKAYDIDFLTASILTRRGIVEPAEIACYLESDFRFLHNPFLFHAMEDAVDRILLAVEEDEEILVFGDSDTDGVTSTTLIVETLASLGKTARYKVPSGEEAYGLSIEAVEQFARDGGGLIITVDCGISNHAEVDRAAELGIDVVICDHHKLQVESPPAAIAVIDPKIEGCGYPFRDLAGAGVAFKLSMALKFARSELYKQSIALFSITEEDTDSRETNPLVPQVYAVEAIKLHNMVETARISIKIEEGSPRSARVLEKLASFLSGRSIFVFDGHTTIQNFRKLFGQNVEIECYDLRQEAANAFPNISELTLKKFDRDLGISKYSANICGDIDVFKVLFCSIAQKKAFMTEDRCSDLLQLAALGTIADLMPMKDENRIIVRRGVSAMSLQPRKGIKELLKSLGISREIHATDVAWQITPLLNAAGRIGSPEIALKLLLSEDEAERNRAVEDIVKANNERKKIGAEVWEAIYPKAGEVYESTSKRYILIGSPEVKSGITGLLASRMVGIFKVPAIIAAFKTDGTIVGSIRTANGMRISGLLSECADLFIDYGGHDAAAGFSLPSSNWQKFVDKATAHLGSAELTQGEEIMTIDAELPHAYVKPEVHAIHAKFEPFGQDNKPLVFFSRNVPMVDAQIVGKSAKNHLKLTLDFGQYKWPAMLWDGASRLERDFSFRAKDKVDILYKVTMNRWNGEEKPQLDLYDIRKAESEPQ